MLRRRPVATLVAAGLAAIALAAVSAQVEGAGDLAQASEPVSALATAGTPDPSTPLLSARRVPEWLVTPAADTSLRRVLEAPLAELPDTSCVVVRDGGRTVLGVRPDDPFVPASTMKLLTALAVLTELDPGAPYVTTAVAAEDPVDGVVAGDLWLVGGGDPVLQTPGYAITWEDPDSPPPHTDLSVLADRIRDAGITRIAGGVIGDDSRYDTVRYPESWPRRYVSGGESGPLSALSVNDGFTGLEDDPDTLRSGVEPGDPPVLAAQTLVSLLADRGVAVAGGARAGTAPEGSVELARLESPPLREVVAQALTYSDNTTAELLLKELGLARSGRGTTAAGAAAVSDVLGDLGLPVRDLVVVDGSGLDPANQVTCSLLVEVLEAAGPEGDLAEGLAVAGAPGTLRTRLRSTEAVGALRAKTGTLRGVSALAGWVPGRHGEEIAFAVVANGDAPSAQATQDAVVLALLGHPDRPPVVALEPR